MFTKKITKFEHHCLESMLFQSVLKTPEKQLKQ